MAKTLDNIRAKVRQLTGRKAEAQLSTTELDFQINSYYQTEFPQQLRLLDLRQTYVFQTRPNVAVYNVPPDEFQSVEPPCFVAGYNAYFSMNQAQWNNLWSQLQINEQDATGDGSTGPYTFTTNQNPIYAGSFIVSAPTSFNTATMLIDNGIGQLLVPSDLNGPAPVIRGTVNYNTGAVSITSFDAAVDIGTAITAQYISYNASRPNIIYYYSNQLKLYPIPDQVYEVSVTVYKIPTQLLAGNESPKFAVEGPQPPDPDISEWWEALAYGAAMKIYENNVDMEGMQMMEGLLERKLNLIRRRTWYQLGSQRSKTIYATPTTEVYPGTGFPGIYPGI